ncbi:MAG: ASCH domain-containing protein [Vicinamibacterales bacterium]
MAKKQLLPERGLLIQAPYIDHILDGSKVWELRGSATKIRGRIALIQSASGTVVGTCDVVDVVGPLTLKQLRQNAKKAGMRPSEVRSLLYPKTFGWVVAKARRFRSPVPYKHPSGAVIWVKLTPASLRVPRTTRPRGRASAT